MVPGQGMLVFGLGLGLGLVTGGDRCARDAARQNRQKCLCSEVPLSVRPGPSRPFAFVPKAVLILVQVRPKMKKKGHFRCHFHD